jgi:hypothetical protein
LAFTQAINQPGKHSGNLIELGFELGVDFLAQAGGAAPIPTAVHTPGLNLWQCRKVLAIRLCEATVTFGDIRGN